MRTERKAFTILELLMAVAIMAVLASLLLIGLNVLAKSGKARSSKVSLENCVGMLATYEVQAGLTRLPGGLPGSGTLTAPGDVRAGSADRNGAAVLTTASVLSVLFSMPDNRQARDKLPAKAILGTANGPVILDGWGNPILYCPSDGLVTNSGGAGVTVRSPSGKPFFASAGPDGDFAKGDDNLYSHEN